MLVCSGKELFGCKSVSSEFSGRLLGKSLLYIIEENNEYYI